MFRYALLAGGVVLAAAALFHPAPRPLATAVSPMLPRSPHREPGRAAAPNIVVYVAGAVRKPGLYHLLAGARADDAVRLAGGLGAQADATAVNLAQPLADGDEVDVPRVGQPHRRARTSRRRSHRGHRRASIVSLNAGDAQSLAAVPGIGDAIAQRIVEVRDREGPFDSLDELLDVAGMNAGRLERARPYLRL